MKKDGIGLRILSISTRPRSFFRCPYKRTHEAQQKKQLGNRMKVLLRVHANCNPVEAFVLRYGRLCLCHVIILIHTVLDSAIQWFFG